MKYVIIAFLMIGYPCFAEGLKNAPEQRSETGFVAAIGGPALITSKGGGSPVNFGARADLRLGNDSMAEGLIGIAVNTMTKSTSITSGTITTITAEYLARKAWGTGLYLGARAGLGLNSVTAAGQGASDTVFAFAPVIGWELPVGTPVLLIEASWETSEGGTFTFGGTPIAYDATQAVLLRAGIGIEF
ncbi:MAG TPA: hypothetical protein VL588_11380 [Bdellovibrionota bacterium]|nr:hypothetical protein [Bdellovibrionota bacterium]